jgi:hypothetical protein
MAETYDITHESALVGTARMEKQGLYYVFSCRCRLPKEGLYRIHAINGDAREDLGICIPMDGVFGMDKKVPQKRIGEGILTFELVPKDWKPQEIVPEPEPILQVEETVQSVQAEEIAPPSAVEESFIPVSEDEPFDYLDKLEDARVEVRDDQVGIVIQE